MNDKEKEESDGIGGGIGIGIGPCSVEQKPGEILYVPRHVTHQVSCLCLYVMCQCVSMCLCLYEYYTILLM